MTMNFEKIDPVPMICTKCHSALSDQVGQVKCPYCHTTWQKKDGICTFGDLGNRYWGEIPRTEMTKILDIEGSQGWREASQNFLRILDPYVYRYACDESRADWRFLLPITKQSQVLDFGCGWGIVSWALSRSAGNVVSVDSTYERVAFLNKKILQEGVENIQPLLVATLDDLPFAPESFDLIVLNGVLEWIPEGEINCTPIEAQQHALRKFHELLKPSGTLYVGIENRYGYNYFLGGLDHTGLRFTSLLPRWLADFISNIYLNHPYRTWTYSIAGYKKLLGEIGFDRQDYWWLYPRYQEPQFAIPLDSHEIVTYYIVNIFIAKSLVRRMVRLCVRLLNFFHLLKFFVPAYGILAYKDNGLKQ